MPPDISSSAAQRLTRRLMHPTAEERAEEILAHEWNFTRAQIESLETSGFRVGEDPEAYEFRMASHANLQTELPARNFTLVLEDPAPVIELPELTPSIRAWLDTQPSAVVEAVERVFRRAKEDAPAPVPVDTRPPGRIWWERLLEEEAA